MVNIRNEIFDLMKAVVLEAFQGTFGNLFVHSPVLYTGMRGSIDLWGWWLSNKESSCIGGSTGDASLIPVLGRFPGGGKWQLSPVFLPGKFHG